MPDPAADPDRIVLRIAFAMSLRNGFDLIIEAQGSDIDCTLLRIHPRR
jgi:hypothetical protein